MRDRQQGAARRRRLTTGCSRIGSGLSLGVVAAGLVAASVVAAGLVAVGVVGTPSAGASTPSAGASTTAADSVSVSPTSGPVGTEVHLSGDMGPCPELPTIGGQRTAFVELVRGSGGLDQPNEWINVPVAADGSWRATFVIPSFVGGQAMTQGSPGGDVTPGTWTFDAPTCNSAPVAVGFTVTSSAPAPARFAAIAGTPDGKGYWLAQAGGGVFSYGDATFYGSLPGLGIKPAAPIVGIASTPDGHGYWLVGADGGVFAFGDAAYYGSLPGDHITPFGAIVGLTPTPDGHGYWLVGADGGVFAFGDAAFLGSGNDGVPRAALLATSDGSGYLLPASTGLPPAVYGDATALGGNTTPMPLAAPVTGAAVDPGTNGYWETSADGGVYAFGSAPFDGSLPGIGVTPAAPIMAMAAASGGGYWLLGADGGVFAFGGAGFFGSAA